MVLKINTITTGIQTDISIDILSVFPSAKEKSLQKYMTIHKVIATKTYPQLLPLYFFPKVKTPANKTMLIKKKGKDIVLWYFPLMSLVE